MNILNELISLREASHISGYHSDYLSFLIRSRKLTGQKVGRAWFIDKNEFEDFLKQKEGLKNPPDPSSSPVRTIVNESPRLIQSNPNFHLHENSRTSGGINLINFFQKSISKGVFATVFILGLILGTLSLPFIAKAYPKFFSQIFGNVATVFLAGGSPQTNYQGKLTEITGIAVPNNNYNIRFNLYSTSTGGTPIWTETHCYGSSCQGSGTDNRVQVTNGLFSTMLGSVNSLSGIDFNQVLYLGVEIGGTSTAPESGDWDTEMVPRKRIGVVPSAFIASSLNGVSDTQFVRLDTANATSSNGALLTLTQNGAGNIVDFYSTTTKVFYITSGGNSFLTGNISALNLSGTSTGINTGDESSSTIRTKIGAATSTNDGYLSSSDWSIFNNKLSTETDPIWMAASSSYLTTANASSTYYRATNPAGYISSYTEVDPIWSAASTSYLSTTSAASTYIPYTGATTNVNLNNKTLVNVGNVGIGTTTPSAKLEVYGTAGNNAIANFASSSNTSALYIAANGNVGIGNNSPEMKLQINLGNSNTAGFQGINVSGNMAATSSTQYGIVSNPKMAASSTGNLIGFFTRVDSDNFVDLASSYGMYIANPSKGSTSTITNNYGLYVQNMNAGTNNYAIYSNGGLNYLSGSVGIGTTTPETALSVIGTSTTQGLRITNLTSSLIAVDSSGNVIATTTPTSSQWTTNSSNIYYNTGNVGIGTTTPAQLLSLSGSNPFIKINNTGSGFLGLEMSGISGGGIYMEGSVAQQLYSGTLAKAMVVGNAANNAVQFAPGNDVKMTLLSSGNVGIGTTAPGVPLHLYSTAATDLYERIEPTNSSYAAILNLKANGSNGFMIQQGTGAAGAWGGTGSMSLVNLNAYPIAFFTDATERMRITSTGNVGIGTTSPLGLAVNYGTLDIRGSSGGGVRFGVTGATSSYLYNDASTLTLGSTNQQNITFNNNNGGTTMTILGTGNVGIGTTNPASKLTIAGTTEITSGNLVIDFGQITAFKSNDDNYLQLSAGTGKNAFIQLWGNGPANNGDGSLIKKYADDDRLSLSAYATEQNQLVLAANGNVGIGTSTPTELLHVVGSSGKGEQIGSSISPTTVPSGTYNYLKIINNAGQGPDRGGMLLLGGAKDNSNTRTDVFGAVAGLKGTDADAMDGYLSFYTNNGTSIGEKMRITSAGNVSIGTTTSQGKFTVHSAIDKNLVIDTIGTGEMGIASYTDASGYATIGLNANNFIFETQSDTKMVILQGGNVGIGTTSPSRLLTVEAVNPRIEIRTSSSTTSGYLLFGDPNADAQGGVRYNNITDSLSFRSNNTDDRLLIDSTGNVGIGTTNPAQGKLEISAPNTVVGRGLGSVAQLFVHDSSTSQGADVGGRIDLGGYQAGLSTYYTAGGIKGAFEASTGNKGYLTFYTQDSGSTLAERMRIDGNGNVGIGTTSPTSKLQVAGGNVMIGAGTPYSKLSLGQTAGVLDRMAFFEFPTGNALRGIGYSEPSTGGVAIWAINGDVAPTNSNMTMFIKDATNGNGNVGIGTTSPGALLHAYTTGSTEQANFERYGGTAATRGKLRIQQSNIGYSGGTGADSLLYTDWGYGFYVNGQSSLVNAMTITNGGNVGIGTTNPGQKLEVSGGNVLIGGSAEPVLTLASNNVTSGSPHILLNRVVTGTPSSWWLGDSRNTADFDIYDNYSSVVRMTIQKSTGNVGIGTINPGKKLHVIGDITFGSADTGDFNTIEFNTVPNSPQQIYTSYNGSYAEQPLQLGTNSHKDAVHIGITGNVGIGVTSPTHKLEIIGDSYITGNSYLDSGAGNRFIQWVGGTYPTIRYLNGGDLQIYEGSTGGQFVTFQKTTGNVGIGTTNPAYLLDVNKGATSAYPLNLTSSNKFVRIGALNSTYAHMDTDADAGFYMYDALTVAGANSFLGLSSQNTYLAALGGNVGIGTTNPGAKLQVGTYASEIRLGDSNGTGSGSAGSLSWVNQDLYQTAQIEAVYNGAGTYGALLFKTNYGNSLATERMRIDKLGNVGIGTSTPTTALSVIGTVSQSAAKSCALSSDANGGIICTSDENLKDLHGYYTGGLAELSAINPIRFSYKDEDYVHIGFSAQNVNTILPEATPVQGNGYYGLDTNAIIALVVNSVKQIGSFISKIENGIAYLKNIVVENFAVGSQNNPSGITMYDEASGNPYCVKIVNGSLRNINGACVAASSTEGVYNTAAVLNTENNLTPITSTSTSSSTDSIDIGIRNSENTVSSTTEDVFSTTTSTSTEQIATSSNNSGNTENILPSVQVVVPITSTITPELIGDTSSSTEANVENASTTGGEIATTSEQGTSTISDEAETEMIASTTNATSTEESQLTATVFGAKIPIVTLVTIVLVIQGLMLLTFSIYVYNKRGIK